MPSEAHALNRQSFGDTDDLYGEEPFSPRSELLSSASSPRRRDDGGSDDRPRRRRGASERYRREREQVHSGASHREVTRLLVDQEYETAKIRKGLIDALDRLRLESTRADEAERSRAEMVANFRTLNESRVKALKEVEKVTQELQMYKLQYEHAQNEITRAQGILKVLQEQKDDAERSAARSRRIVRELNQNRLITEAKEEGRRLGFAAGFRRAQTELGAAAEADSNIDDAILAMELREGQGEEEYFHDDHNQDVDQEPSPPPPEPVPIAQPVPQFSPQAAPPLLSSHSPAVEPYSLPIPSADQLNGPVRRTPFAQPPDNYIPQSTDGGVIPLPPPFELAGSRYPQMPPSSPHSPSAKLPYISLDDPQPLHPHAVPKTNSNHSRRHSIGSASTSSRISQLDLLKTAPNGDRGPLRPRNERELSMIREDGNSSRAGTPSHQRSKSAMSQPSQNSFRSKGNVAMDPNLPPPAEQGRSQPPPDPNSRYDDGRYTGRGDARDWAPQSGRPPRHYPRPANLTVPAPLSAGGAVPGPSRHNRSFSDASSSFYGNANSSGRREHGRMTSNHSLASTLGKPIAGIFSALGMSRKDSHPESEEITINVDPPSGPSSGRTHFQPSLQDTNSYLSPQNAPGPLPMPTSTSSSYMPQGVRPSSPLIPTVPNTPTQPPLQWPNQDPRQGGRPPARVVPQGPRGPSRSRSPPSRQVAFHPEAIYTQEPGRVPSQPPSLRRVKRAASGTSDMSGRSAGTMNRSVSGSAVYPGGSAQPMASHNGDGNGDGAAATLGQHHELHRIPSNASMRSGSYDPSKYLDPAFYGADGT
ncbi:hypothetical protein AB1N83_010184 [Pleurotus pulmonarius]